MGKYIIADNQELTRYALESLLRDKGNDDIYRSSDKTGLVELLKQHENAIVLLDYTLFDFADADQLLIIGERFAVDTHQRRTDTPIPASGRVFIASVQCRVQRWPTQ